MLKKVAVIRTDKIGDMILTMPMCRAIKAVDAGIELSVIARRYVEPLLYLCPFIDKIFYTDDFKSSYDIFKKEKFDAVFFPRPRFEEIFASFHAGIKNRIGSAFRWYSFLLNHKIYDHRKIGEFHESKYNVRLVNSFFKTDFKPELIKPVINETSSQKVQSILHEKNIYKFIIIHPGTGGSAYDWNAANFGILAKKIQSAADYKILITGIDSEMGKCLEAMEECPGAINFCGKLNLSEMIALIAKSSLLIANSTGILHVGAATGIPVIGLFPNTSHLSPRRWGPYSEKAVVITPPLTGNIDDMQLITVEKVFKKVMEII